MCDSRLICNYHGCITIAHYNAIQYVEGTPPSIKIRSIFASLIRYRYTAAGRVTLVEAVALARVREGDGEGRNVFIA